MARWRLLGLLLLLGGPRWGWAGIAIEGTVTLPRQGAAPVLNQRYEVVTRGGVLSTNPPVGVVYLEGPFPASPEPVTYQVVQKDMTFVPMLLPIQTGSRVEFPNHDDTYHNIFSYSAPKRFDLGRYRPDEQPVPAVTFDRPGLVVLRCDIHEHMRGLILVLDTPFFARTDTDGRYRLTGLPAGRYVLRAWIDSKTTLSRPVDLHDGVTLRIDFP